MPITLITTSIEAYDESDRVVFRLRSEDKDVHKLEMDDFVTADGLTELFDAIRVAVRMMDAERTTGGEA
jgi:hypothetical protein